MEVEHAYGIVTLFIVSAQDVPVMDIGGKSDPYCIIKYGNKKIETPIIYKSLNPVWNFQTRILLTKSEINYNVEIELWDNDKLKKDKYIATCNWCFSDITKYSVGEFIDFRLPFIPDLGKRKKLYNKIKKSKKEGELLIRASFHPVEDMEKMFWKEIFQYFDEDGSKSIDVHELQSLIQSLDKNIFLSKSGGFELDQIFGALDKNKDGTVSEDEIISFMCDKSNPILAKLWPNRDMAILHICNLLLDGNSIADIVVDTFDDNSIERLYGAPLNSSLKNQILVTNRLTGKMEVELMPAYLKVTMKLMYKNKIGKKATSKNRVKKILKRMTIRQGSIYNDPSSIKNIHPFIEFHKLNVGEILDPISSFANFNEFFFRKLKDGARTIDHKKNTKVVVSPADCRLHVFPSIEKAQEIWIKGETFTLKNLLLDDSLADYYEGGSIVIARLAPQDYHRFHCPIDGIFSHVKLINGGFYTVNPIAIKQKSIDVYCENKRFITTIQTENFGQVCFIAVGATMVGSIEITSPADQMVRKGDELGYFAFGGSTCIVLFHKDTLTFDEDLLANSNKGIETLVQVGNQMGVSLD